MKRDNPDSNAKELYANLKEMGWCVVRVMSAATKIAGIPDAVVARKGSRRNHFLEVKSLGAHRNRAQTAFGWSWPGCVHVAHSSYEANQLLEECEARR